MLLLRERNIFFANLIKVLPIKFRFLYSKLCLQPFLFYVLETGTRFYYRTIIYPFSLRASSSSCVRKFECLWLRIPFFCFASNAHHAQRRYTDIKYPNRSHFSSIVGAWSLWYLQIELVFLLCCKCERIQIVCNSGQWSSSDKTQIKKKYKSAHWMLCHFITIYDWLYTIVKCSLFRQFKSFVHKIERTLIQWRLPDPINVCRSAAFGFSQ